MSNIEKLQRAYSQTARGRRYHREYMPGYTGFVPTRRDHFGQTSAKINETINKTGGCLHTLDQMERERTLTLRKNELPTSREMNKEVFGNRSREAVNWIGGPTHMVRRQMIPGYAGHQQGSVNKGLIHKSFAKVTAELFSEPHPTSPKQILCATQREQFRGTNFRRFGKSTVVFDPRLCPVTEPEREHGRDYADYAKHINENKSDQR